MDQSNQDKSFTVYNSKSDYQNKVTYGQKANGELQVKEVTLRSDTMEGLLELGLDSFEDFFKMCKKRHLKRVSSYEVGYEPAV